MAELSTRDDVERAAPERPSTFIVVDDDGRFVDAPPEALRLYGVTLEELREHRIGDFAPEGIGPIHRALFLLVARHGRDYGGGSSTIVGRHGEATRVRCTSIEPDGDRYRIALDVEPGRSAPPHSEAIASVLEAWRQAERDIAGGLDDPDFDVATKAAASLRDIYHFIVDQRTAADETSAERV